jgi:hypothetical protein
MLKIIVASFCAAIFTVSCTVQNISETADLAADDGILIATVHCASNINWFEFYETGKTLNNLNHMFVGKAGSSGCSKDNSELKTIKVQAGKYFIGVVGGGRGDGTIPEEDSVSFQIEAGKVNYIGDIRIISSKPVDTGLNASTVYFSFRVEDTEQQTKAALNSEYPWLLARYEFTKLLAENQSIEGGADMTRTKDAL